MRHGKLRPGTATNAAELGRLIEAAYADIKARAENGLAQRNALGGRRGCEPPVVTMCRIMFADRGRITGNPEVICSSVGLVPTNALVSGIQYFKLIGRSVISSWVTAEGDFIRFYSVTSS